MAYIRNVHVYMYSDWLYFSISPAILYAVVTLGGLAMIWVTLCYVYRYVHVRVGCSTLCTIEDAWSRIVPVGKDR